MSTGSPRFGCPPTSKRLRGGRRSLRPPLFFAGGSRTYAVSTCRRASRGQVSRRARVPPPATRPMARANSDPWRLVRLDPVFLLLFRSNATHSAPLAPIRPCPSDYRRRGAVRRECPRVRSPPSFRGGRDGWITPCRRLVNRGGAALRFRSAARYEPPTARRVFRPTSPPRASRADHSDRRRSRRRPFRKERYLTFCRGRSPAPRLRLGVPALKKPSSLKKKKPRTRFFVLSLRSTARRGQPRMVPVQTAVSTSNVCRIARKPSKKPCGLGCSPSTRPGSFHRCSSDA